MKPIGEIALIEQIRREFPTARRSGSGALRLGIGDDCAILRPPPGHEVLVTTDFTLESRHFDRRLHPPESAGHRALARGLSDLAAMGATPMAVFLSLALPPDLLASAQGRAWLRRFFHGLRALAALHRVPLAGGDTSESPVGARGGPGLDNTGLILADIVLVGSAPSGKALRRSGASPGDLLYVTGHLGGAAAELAGLTPSSLRVKTPRNALDPSRHPQLFPVPRVEVGRTLLRRNLASAAIDLSDGLSTDLAHLCRASGVAAEVEETLLPLHPLLRRLEAPRAVNLALNGGEDYELLFSAPPSARVPRSIAGVSITRIGRLTKQKPDARKTGAPFVTLIQQNAVKKPLKPAGWEHFSTNSGHKSTLS
jgi:thiamine-monophosphate kinase